MMYVIKLILWWLAGPLWREVPVIASSDDEDAYIQALAADWRARRPKR